MCCYCSYFVIPLDKLVLVISRDLGNERDLDCEGLHHVNKSRHVFALDIEQLGDR